LAFAGFVSQARALQLEHLLGRTNLINPLKTNNTAKKVTQPSTPSQRGHQKALTKISAPVINAHTPPHLSHKFRVI